MVEFDQYKFMDARAILNPFLILFPIIKQNKKGNSMADLQNNVFFTPQRGCKATNCAYQGSTDAQDLSSNCIASTKTNYSSPNLTDYISTFNPYLQCSSMEDVCEAESHAVTDRFIPSRRMLRKESLFRDEDMDSNIENEGCPSEGDRSTVSDLYRRFIMTESPKKNKDSHIESFQNTNILKYTSKINSNVTDAQLQSKSSTLQLADEICSGSPQKRKISKLPCKVLDAPALQDDYYLNLIDWSTQNLMAVGLSSSVYLWNASNSKVNKLCDLGVSDSATSVSWSLKGPTFAVGTNSGDVQIWDVVKMKKLRTMTGHTNRVGAMSWNSTLLSTGSRDKSILHRDLRTNSPFLTRLLGHKQQICGLKWSFDEQQLCSGGNDNKLLVWNSHCTEPILKYCDHLAAVKAVAWSPHQHGLLVSGGGTADRTIKFRNTLTGVTVKSMDVGSQVCNLMFSKTMNQLVSTHGYSQNEINIWKYPKMQKTATLTGHTFRVLYLAMSPDGSTIVTGAGDETLRFWNVFPNRSESCKKPSSILNTDTVMLRL